MSSTSSHPTEIEKFNQLASRWWDPQGPCKPLHALNPLRLAYIEGLGPLKGLKVLDVGCGGGLLSEAMAARGATVTGLDLADALLEVAGLHAAKSGLKITYLLETIQEHADQHSGEYDLITCMEMLEHVPCPQSILEACRQALKPGGNLVLSTLNRTPQAFIEAILGAEYLLKMLPKGTHRFESFIKPSELEAGLRQAGLEYKHIQGIRYNPLTSQFKLSANVQVNYLMSGVAPL